jgi:outer membrane receptor for ferrienterochelin and colicins
MFNGTLRYTASDRIGTWLRVEARGSRTRGTSAAAQAATATLGDYKPYGLVHLGGSYTLTRHITFNATLFNVLNTNFLAYEPYTLNGQVQYASPYNNLQEPLRAWASMNVTF